MQSEREAGWKVGIKIGFNALDDRRRRVIDPCYADTDRAADLHVGVVVVERRHVEGAAAIPELRLSARLVSDQLLGIERVGAWGRRTWCEIEAGRLMSVVR